jgi:cell division septal protein FtsQ
MINGHSTICRICLISVNLKKKKMNKAMRLYKTIDPKLHSKVKILYYDIFFL